MLVAVLHSLLFLWCWLLFFIHCCFCDAGCCSLFITFQRHPSPFCELSPGFYTHFIFLAQLIAGRFTTLSSQPFRALLLQFYLERYGFERAFFTRRRFLPYILSPHFWHNLLLSRSPWEPVVLPWCLQGFMLILKTQTRSICLFDSQQSTTLIFRKIRFKSYQILLWITCGKKFSLSAPYSFRTLFAFSKSNVKTNKKHFEQCLYCL